MLLFSGKTVQQGHYVGGAQVLMLMGSGK